MGSCPPVLESELRDRITLSEMLPHTPITTTHKRRHITRFNAANIIMTSCVGLPGVIRSLLEGHIACYTSNNAIRCIYTA